MGHVDLLVSLGSGGMSAASHSDASHSGSGQPSPSELDPGTSITAYGGKAQKPKSMLVISGGEGYIDFRIGEFPFALLPIL